jgi:hypothetical protein
MYEADTNDTDYTNGKGYQFQIDGATIGIGTDNTYYFAAHDGTYKAIGDTLDQTGPVVNLGTPVADAGVDLVVDEDEVFRLDGSGSEDDGTIVGYYWDMDASVDSDGDGIFDNDRDATGVDATWKYTSPGDYIVTLIVVDDQGVTDNDTILITVEPKEDEEGVVDNEFVFYSIIIVIIVIIILIIVLAILRKRVKEEEEYKKLKKGEEEEAEEEEEEEEEDLGEEEEFECPSCGALLAADDEVCPECGEEFEEE